MKLSLSRRALGIAASLLLCFLLSACSSNDAAYMAAPKVGDLYAAELTHFTEFTDDDGNDVKEGYGLLKVIKVDGEQVTVITTNWYNNSKRQVLKELRTEQGAEQWDTSDEIAINRAELSKLREGGEIYDIKRPQG